MQRGGETTGEVDAKPRRKWNSKSAVRPRKPGFAGFGSVIFGVCGLDPAGSGNRRPIVRERRIDTTHSQ
jgi:hypothetical protein